MFLALLRAHFNPRFMPANVNSIVILINFLNKVEMLLKSLLLDPQKKTTLDPDT